ncbi:hypothetical protein P3W23_09100 [Luteibacter sp. PPL554]
MHRLFPHVVYTADAITRNELSNKTVVTEPVYMATLMSRVRDLWHLIGGKCRAYAQVVDPKTEQYYGIDVVVHLHSPDGHKLLALEAKRPTFPEPRGKWDYVTKGTQSHFSQQLDRQIAHIDPSVVFGGLFLDARPHYAPVAGFDPLGSLFCDSQALKNHENAFMAKRTTHPYWTNADVASLVAANPLSGATPPLGHVLNLQELLQKIMDCGQGGRINARNFPKILTAMARARAAATRREGQRPPSDKDVAAQIAYAFGCAQVLTLEIDWFKGDGADVARLRQWNLSQRKATPGSRTKARRRS